MAPDATLYAVDPCTSVAVSAAASPAGGHERSRADPERPRGVGENDRRRRQRTPEIRRAPFDFVFIDGAQSVAATVAEIAAEAGIRRLRPARNCGERRGSLRLVLHRRYNAWLKRRGLMRVHYFRDDRRSAVARAACDSQPRSCRRR